MSLRGEGLFFFMCVNWQPNFVNNPPLPLVSIKQLFSNVNRIPTIFREIIYGVCFSGIYGRKRWCCSDSREAVDNRQSKYRQTYNWQCEAITQIIHSLPTQTVITMQQIVVWNINRESVKTALQNNYWKQFLIKTWMKMQYWFHVKHLFLDTFRDLRMTTIFEALFINLKPCYYIYIGAGFSTLTDYHRLFISFNILKAVKNEIMI